MNRVVTSRVAWLMTAAIVVVIAACSDTDASKPTLTGLNQSSSQGGSTGDSAKGNPPSNPGGGHSDTSVTPKPGPKPVASFTLLIHVGSLLPGATDTLTTNPIPGATVSVFEQTLTPNNNPGADTVNISQTLVATGVSDAAGNFSAANLKGAAVYVVKVAPPAGSNFGPATTYLNQAFADLVKLPVTLFPK